MKKLWHEILQGTLISCMLLGIAIGAPIIFLIEYQSINELNLKKHGNQIIMQIEAYKSKNGKLPQSLTELGLKDFPDEPIVYEKKSETNYTVFFGTSLGESTTYSSETHKWDDEGK